MKEDDGDQNEGNLGCCTCVISKQQNRNSAKFGDHPIPNSQFFTGEHNFRGSKSVVSRRGLGGMNLSDRLESLIEKLLQHEQLLESWATNYQIWAHHWTLLYLISWIASRPYGFFMAWRGRREKKKSITIVGSFCFCFSITLRIMVSQVTGGRVPAAFRASPLGPWTKPIQAAPRGQFEQTSDFLNKKKTWESWWVLTRGHYMTPTQTRQFWRRNHSITIVFAFFDPVMR